MSAFGIAWRNIMRKPRRTAVTIAAVSLNTGVLIFAYAMMDGMLVQLMHDSTHTHVGDVQLHARGYLADRSIYKSIPEPGRFMTAAEAAGFGATARSFGFGLVSMGTKSAGASYWGIDPEREKSAFEMARKLERGTFLSPEPRAEVVIGRRLAKSLQALIGSELVAVVQAADGSVGNELYTVVGVLQSVGDEIDRGGVLMHRHDFDRLFAAGGRIHEIAVLGEPDAAQIATLFEQGNSSVVVGTWRELMPTLNDMLNMSDASMGIFAFVFLLSAGLGVLNTMFMATHDRVREFGMLRALGTTPTRIVVDVLVEALLLAVVAAVLGAVLGSAASLYFEMTGGMDLTRWQGGSLMFSGVPFEPIYRFDLLPGRVVTAVVAMCLTCVAASLFPALKAARLDPVKAMTHQ